LNVRGFFSKLPVDVPARASSLTAWGFSVLLGANMAWKRKLGDFGMGVRYNMTGVEYKLHEAYWRGVFKKLFTNPALHPLWWKLVVSWCNVIELRYGNFQREWFLDRVCKKDAEQISKTPV
jgi:hypothetical protein